MARIVLDAETAKTPIGEMLRAATESEIELKDESGKLLARIVVASGEETGFTLVFGSPDGDRAGGGGKGRDVTTQELLDHLQSLSRE